MRPAAQHGRAGLLQGGAHLRWRRVHEHSPELRAELGRSIGGRRRPSLHRRRGRRRGHRRGRRRGRQCQLGLGRRLGSCTGQAHAKLSALTRGRFPHAADLRGRERSVRLRAVVRPPTWWRAWRGMADGDILAVIGWPAEASRAHGPAKAAARRGRARKHRRSAMGQRGSRLALVQSTQRGAKDRVGVMLRSVLCVAKERRRPSHARLRHGARTPVSRQGRTSGHCRSEKKKDFKGKAQPSARPTVIWAAR